MTSTVESVVQMIVAEPLVMGLGNLEVRSSGSGLLLEDPAEAILYAVRLCGGPVTDASIIRLVEYWAAVRREYPGRRCIAVFAAEQMSTRYRDVLAAITGAVPLLVLEMSSADGAPRFTRLSLP